MGRKKQVGIDDRMKGREAVKQFEDKGGEIVGVSPVTRRFLRRFTGHVSLLHAKYLSTLPHSATIPMDATFSRLR